MSLNPLTGEPYSANHQEIQKRVSQLPVNQPDVVRRLRKAFFTHDVVVLSASTGAGKTTGVPQHVLHFLREKRGEARVLVTQPRSIPTQSLAARVAAELDVPLGQHVGYQYRFHRHHRGQETRLLFLTEGTLVQKLRSHPTLDDVDAVLLDEAHERTLEMDLLLLFLREAVLRRRETERPLHLVIMSATADRDTFVRYFRQEGLAVGVTEVAGIAHPVETRFAQAPLPTTRDVWTMAVRTAAEAVRDLERGRLMTKAHKAFQGWPADRQDVLVFLSTRSELDRAVEAFGRLVRPEVARAMALSSESTDDEKQRATEATASSLGTRHKVVFATNIAETSLTIPTLAVVVDAGQSMQSGFDPETGFGFLRQGWISQASARQRIGRAGRTQPGVALLLYTEEQMKREFPAHTDPAMLREGLAELSLQLLTLDPSRSFDELKKDVFQRLPTPPKQGTLAQAERLLQEWDALDEDGLLTPSGQSLETLAHLGLPMARALLVSPFFICRGDAVSFAALGTVFRRFEDAFEGGTTREEKKALYDKWCRSAGRSEMDALLDLYRRWRETSGDEEARAALVAEGGLDAVRWTRVDLERRDIDQRLRRAALLTPPRVLFPLRSSDTRERLLRCMLQGFRRQVAVARPRGASPAGYGVLQSWRRIQLANLDPETEAGYVMFVQAMEIGRTLTGGILWTVDHPKWLVEAVWTTTPQEALQRLKSSAHPDDQLLYALAQELTITARMGAASRTRKSLKSRRSRRSITSTPRARSTKRSSR